MSQTAPPLGVTLRCRVVEVVDGDTVTVEWTHRARVRLMDCWAPELRRGTTAQKRRGAAAKRHLEQLALDQVGVLHVPSEYALRIGDLTSLGRVLGDFWPDSETKSVAALMRESGHATKTKQDQE